MPGIPLEGLPIAITGASSGIGRATAIACARAGMPVALAARRVEKLGHAAAEIAAMGGRAIVVPCDVANKAECEALVERTVEAFGSIYSVFANAGYGVEGPVHEMSQAALRDIFEVNFFGSMNCITPALPHMRRAGRGHIHFCSSCLSKIGTPYFAAYSATKAAQDHFARAMRHELAPQGIRVSSVHPIGTRTEFFEQTAGRSDNAALALRTPEGFLQPPERVARAVVACLRRPRGEVWTSLPIRVGLGLSIMMPRLTDVALRWAMRRRGR